MGCEGGRVVRISLWEAGGCQRLVEHLRMEQKTVAFQALPILEAFLTPVKNSSIRVSTSLCGLFIGAYF